jgi:2-epi-5-epi-valiolone synthase
MYRMHCATSRSYDVLLAPAVLEPGNRALAEAIGDRPSLFVTDPTVDALFGDRLRAYLATLGAPAGLHVAELSEHSKSISTVLEICVQAQRHGLGRRDPLVAVGGGVCCDVVSLAATLVRRGIPYICIPTTLIGQVDAGIGLKGGVNFGGAKSYLGCFTPPGGVLIDPTFLLTLPVEELRAGLAEIIKVALVLDAELFERVSAHGQALAASGFETPPEHRDTVIARAVELMLDQLSGNCYEDQSLERLVDFGHTFSPRLEEVSGHQLKHGPAVAIDMALTCALGTELGLLSAADLETVLEVLIRLGLPVHTPLSTLETSLEAIAGAVRHRDGALNLVVPTGIGSATFVRSAAEIPNAAIVAAIDHVAGVGAVTAARRPAGMAV